MEEKIAKDCVVEVCSEEEGFTDTWFRGILEEKPTKSGRKKLRVRYLTLLDEDGSSPLIEKIEPRFIRPVPPENEYKGVVLEEGSMVDADHKDGWWTGVVIKKLENDKFLVYYDSPPDIIEFERKQLRAHIRWTGRKWDHPGIQELDKSMFSSGSMVEVSTVIDKAEVAWFPAMIVKEIKVDDGKKFVVKDCNKHLSFNGDEARTNTIVDSCRVRPTPPPFPVEDYTMSDRVEAFRGSVWRQGLVRGVLADKRYMVSLGATEGESVYKHSDLRPCKVWEDGVWLNGPKRNPIEATPLNVIKTKPMRSCSGAKSMTPKRTAKHTRRSHTPLTITPQVKSIESVKPLTPSPAITVTPLKQTQADTQGKTSPKKTLEPMRNKNGLKTNSTQQKMLEEKNSEEKGRKRKRGEIHNSDLKETANESVSPVISSPVITSTQLKHTKAETQGKTFPKKTFQPMRIQNGLENETTQEKGKPEKETPSDGKRNNSMALETRNVQTKEPLLAQGLRNEMADGLLNGYTLDITPQVDSPVKTSNEKTLEPLRNGNESTREKMPEEHNSEDNSRKRKRGELEHNSDLNETVLSSDRTPNVMKNFAADDDERTKAKDATMVLPFVKKSPVWKTCESMEVFKRVPQSPHFSPLFETKEDFREGFALGMMVTFSGVLEKVKDLKTDVPLSQLNSLKDSFTELKKHGFNVTTPLSRINKLLALKDRQVNILKELEGFDKDMTDESSDKCKAEEEFGEMERKILEVKQKILELQRQEAALEKQKDATYEKICQMESRARDLGVELEDVEFEFETILSAPW